nr:reverse transcriptase domain-containing protein [Tanacetum cinerariifolium]
MQGTVLTVVDRETQFNNEFDQFIAEPGESLVPVYNRFAQLMNDLIRNKIDLPSVTINTKFLNYLQPEWLKYVTNVRLVRDLTRVPYDDLFDYLQQYEKIVIASNAKKLEKTHDPLALVVQTISSQSSPACYVTHPIREELQEARTMFKKKMLRVVMFRKRPRMYKEIFKLLLLEMSQMFSVTTAMRKEIHVTWDHLEKKQTRLRLYTKNHEELFTQSLETASQPLEHKAYWALKHANFNLKTAGYHRKVQINELSELRDQAYENSLIYKEKTKRLHDSKIKNRVFNIGDRVLLFNFGQKIFSSNSKDAGLPCSLFLKFIPTAPSSCHNLTDLISKLMVIASSIILERTYLSW